MPNYEHHSSPQERLLAHLREGDQQPPDQSWDELYGKLLAAADAADTGTDDEDCLGDIATENRAHSRATTRGAATTASAPIGVLLACTLRPLITAAETVTFLLSAARHRQRQGQADGHHHLRNRKAPVGTW
ncbi:hypothetical protein [Streptomyces chartreusis]|uniref:hypothetical protein n=1 Tax=Streptomyces chartreusis TaxID=1969 RepID=UPI003667328D